MGKDSLTGLYGIKEFILKGGDIVLNSTDNFAVVAVDLSNFRYLNDMYGMDKGDEVIVFVANEFFCNNPSCALACHTVGDQFRGLINVGSRTMEEEIKIISEKNAEIEQKLEGMFPKVYLHVYTGLYFIDRETFDFSNFNMRTIVDKAHFAKKQVKGNFENSCAIYHEEEYKDFSRQMEIVKIFENACVNDGVRVFFQPKMDCHSHRIIGAEALCRLVDENGNYISPGLFIPVLEKNGMLVRLDAIMMEKTFEHMHEWKEQGKLNIPVSINLSRVDFYNKNLAKQIIALQKKYDIPTENIELEVTESTFIEDMNLVIGSIIELRKYGFKISVDDFGSGYSSLGLLTSMPADIVKLDCAFARQGLKSEKGIEIVESVISMLRKIDFDIICEGVETKDEEALIDSLGCHKIQGYLYDKPLPKGDFEKKYVLC
ncbi:MAG: GGDEF domain-containing phosphodiesterase [Lachnospiraceae bacterium]|nr:GGDEF domain-containing phosphodiesterase [Lachnospiraceae bacterium]